MAIIINSRVNVMQNEIITYPDTSGFELLEVTSVERILANTEYTSGEVSYDELNDVTYFNIDWNTPKVCADFSHLRYLGVNYTPISFDWMSNGALVFAGDLRGTLPQYSSGFTYYYYKSKVRFDKTFPNYNKDILKLPVEADYLTVVASPSIKNYSLFYDELSNAIYCLLQDSHLGADAHLSVGNEISPITATCIAAPAPNYYQQYISKSPLSEFVGLTHITGYAFGLIDTMVSVSFADGYSTIVPMGMLSIPADTTAVSYKKGSKFVTFEGNVVNGTFVVAGDVTAHFPSLVYFEIFYSYSSVVEPVSMPILGIQHGGDHVKILLDGKIDGVTPKYLYMDKTGTTLHWEKVSASSVSYAYQTSSNGLYRAGISGFTLSVSLLNEATGVWTEQFSLDLSVDHGHLMDTLPTSFILSPDFGPTSGECFFAFPNLMFNGRILFSSTDQGASWSYKESSELDPSNPFIEVRGYISGFGAVAHASDSSSFFKFNGTQWVSFSSTGLPTANSNFPIVGTVTGAYTMAGAGLPYWMSTDGLQTWSPLDVVGYTYGAIIESGCNPMDLAYADKLYTRLNSPYTSPEGGYREHVVSYPPFFNIVEAAMPTALGGSYPHFIGNYRDSLYFTGMDGIFKANVADAIPETIDGTLSVPNTAGEITLPYDVIVEPTGDLTLEITSVRKLKGGKFIQVKAGGKIKLTAGRKATVRSGAILKVRAQV